MNTERLRVCLLVCLFAIGFAAAGAAAPVVSVLPIFVSVRGDAQQRFTPYVMLSTNKAVTWSVNGVPGGNAIVGTITGDGLYPAPSILPAAIVTVKATSAADATASGS